MQLTGKDKVENEIMAVLVIPQNDRLYDYYINGFPDKRVMLRMKMLKFCVDLCPSHAGEIRKSVFELTPFVIYPPDERFEELQDKAPAPLNMRNLLFPMGKLVWEDKIDPSKDNEDAVKKVAKNFSIWESYNIHIESEKKKQYKGLFSFFKQ
jgi:hypothetical protein